MRPPVVQHRKLPPWRHQRKNWAQQTQEHKVRITQDKGAAASDVSPRQARFQPVTGCVRVRSWRPGLPNN